MPMLSNLRRAGAAALLVVCTVCIPTQADTRSHEHASGNSPFCSCAFKEDATRRTCSPICEPQQCGPERLDSPGSLDGSCPHIVQSPRLPRSSARPDQTRPAYSRKSNRTQRA